MADHAWKRVWKIAQRYCGSDAKVKAERHILKRLFVQFGPQDLERMMTGGHLLGWTSLRGLGSKDGLGRRWALERYWRSQNHRAMKIPDVIRQVMRGMA